VEQKNLPNIIVLNLNHNPTELSDVITFIKATNFEEETVVVGVSTVMTWGKTNKDSKRSLKETKFKGRKCSVKYKDTKQMETLVLNLKKENVATMVIAAGILYGGEEDAFHDLFKTAWLCEEKSLEIVGEGKNIIPTIHVQDLANIVQFLGANPTRIGNQQYIVAVDSGRNTQAAIVQGISSTLGTGEVINLPALDEKVLLEENGVSEELTVDMKFNVDDGVVAGLDGVDWVAQEGFVANLSNIHKEFITSRKLQPIRVFLHGPPGSGKSHYGRKISTEYYLPHVTIKQAIEEVLNGPPSALKETVTNTMTEITSQQKTQKKKKPTGKKKTKKKGKGEDDERARLPTEILSMVMREKLNSAPCRNKGFVLDGYPRTLVEAQQLFASETTAEAPVDEEEKGDEEEGEKAAEQAPVQSDSSLPEFLISLSVSEENAARRNREMAAELAVVDHNDEDGFRRRWARFHQINDPQQAESESPLGFFSAIESLEVSEELADDEKKAMNFINIYLEPGNRPFNYHPTPEEASQRAMLQDEEAKVQELQAAVDADRKQKVENSEREAGQLANRLRRELVLQEDQQLVEAASLPLRKYLMRSVVPALVDGLLDVCKVQPEDPIDYLAEFLFNYATAHVEG
jgi:adenylate kinase